MAMVLCVYVRQSSTSELCCWMIELLCNRYGGRLTMSVVGWSISVWFINGVDCLMAIMIGVLETLSR